MIVLYDVFLINTDEKILNINKKLFLAKFDRAISLKITYYENIVHIIYNESTFETKKTKKRCRQLK